MNMSLIFGLEDEDPNADNESVNESQQNGSESEECGDDPAEATESFICDSLGISPDELEYFSSEEYRENQVQSLEIGRLRGMADSLGFTKSGRKINGDNFTKAYRDRSTIFLHHIRKEFKSLQEALKSPEVKEYIELASEWRCDHKYQTVKPQVAIKAEPQSFDSKNLFSINGETIFVSRRAADGLNHGGAYEQHEFELKIVYIKSKNPNAEAKGIDSDTVGLIGAIPNVYTQTAAARIGTIGKDKIKTKGFCVVRCEQDDHSIRRKNTYGTTLLDM